MDNSFKNKIYVNRFAKVICLSFFGILIVISLYEALKQFLIPDITIWDSHFMTIVFGSVLFSAVTFKSKFYVNSFGKAICLSFFGMFIGLLLYEALKQFLIPDITIWESHFVTIIFGSMLSSIITLFILKRHYTLRQNAQEKFAKEEELLQESEEKYRNILESINDSYFEVDLRGNLTFCNTVLPRFLGYTLEEIAGMNYRVYMDSETGKFVKKNFQDVYKENISVKVINYEVIKKDGTKAQVETSFSLIKNNGHPIGFRGIGRDVSERKRAEEALRKSEERYRTLFEKTSNPILVINSEGNYIASNRAALEFLECTHEELLTKNVKDYILYGQDEKILEEHRHIWITGGSIEVKHYVHGREKTLFLNITPGVWQGTHEVYGVGTDMTARYQAETALRESETRFRIMAETTASGIFIHRGGNFIYLNPAGQSITGYSERELLEMNAHDLVHPDFREEMRLSWQEAPSNYECKIITKNGGERWVQIYPAVVEYKGQRSILGSVYDITERKCVEEALRKSEQLYRSVIENIQDVFYRSDLTGRLLMASPSGAKTFGYDTINEMIGMPLDFFWPDPKEHRSLLEHIKTAGNVKDYDAILRKKDGTTFNASLTTHFYYDENGSHLGTEGIIRNISERKQAEVALRASEEKYRNIFENAVEGIYQTSPDGLFLNINPSYARIYGYSSPEEMIGNITDLEQQIYVNPEDRKTFKEILERNGIIRGFEVQHYKKGGDKIWVKLNAILANDSTGRILYSGFAEDITKQKTAESEKETLMKQLHQGQKMEAIGTLAGGIAHDFNNILSSLLGYTELAMREFQVEKIKNHLEQVLTACDRARNLVKQILSLSRQNEQEQKPVDIGVITKEALKLLRASLPTTIEIHQRISGESMIVLSNPTQVHQVLMNLCTNAAHAMRERGGLLDVSLTNINISPNALLISPHLQPGSYVQLAVSDTGHGIDPAIIDLIFDPFFTTKEMGEGTGLGLSVVYGIVKNLGGAVTVKSEPGNGATFSVYLPRIDMGTPQKKKKIIQDLPGGTERILFVDDEEPIMEMGKKSLQLLGYDVVAVNSSPEALKLLLDEPDRFDAVVTDMTMPHMTGTELVKKFMELRPEIPIILCTGFSDRISEEKAKELGIRKFFIKPVPMADLAMILRELLDDAKKRV